MVCLRASVGYSIAGYCRLADMGLAAFLLVALSSGCSVTQQSPRAACLQAALEQPGLRNGVAAYSVGGEDTQLVASNMRGWFRLASGRRYSAASLTKVRVAYRVRLMVERGDVNLDQSLNSLLSNGDIWVDELDGVTIRGLLQHTSGAPPADRADPFFYRPGDEAPHPNCAAAVRQISSGSARWWSSGITRYSNVGYCLLGEVLLAKMADGSLLDSDLRSVLLSPMGAAGGWADTLGGIHAGLRQSLPLSQLALDGTPLPDGSWYTFGWRYWPDSAAGARWTHTGRLQGFLAVALTDGEQRLLVAHFDGDPVDYHAAAAQFGRQSWPCMR